MFIYKIVVSDDMYMFYFILILCTSNVQFRVDLYLSIQVSCQTTPKLPLLITSRHTPESSVLATTHGALQSRI